MIIALAPPRPASTVEESPYYAFRHQESATTLIGPSGDCLAHLPSGEEGVLVHAIDREAATGLLASRYAPERYREAVAE